MQDKLDLRLPGKKQPVDNHSKIMLLLISIILIAVLINIGLLFVPIEKREAKPVKSGELPPEARKRMALKLEKQGLHAVAAEVWIGYISSLDLDNTQTARIWYRIGTLQQKANNYVNALTSYYRSESFEQIKELEPEISLHIQECLEALGRYTALKYELKDRVGLSSETSNENNSNKLQKKNGDAIVAEIGPEKISESDLDNRIENEIERQLLMLSSYLTADQRSKQKEQLLKQFASPEQKRIFLHNFLLEEILYREALEDKLPEQPSIQSLLRQQKRRLLAQKVIEKSYQSEIKISESDLKTYYEAHKKEFVSREQAKIAHILVNDEKTAKKIRALLSKGQPFEKLATSYSSQKKAENLSGSPNKDILGWVENREDSQIPSIGKNPEGIQQIFKTPAGSIVKANIISDNGIHIVKVIERKDETQKSFKEVMDDIFRTLRRQKEEEVKKRLFTELEDKYDIVVHTSQFKPSQSTRPENTKPTTATPAP